MSNFGRSAREEMQVKDWSMPQFSEGDYQPETRDYKFTAFGDRSEDVAMTLAQAQTEAEVILSQARETAGQIKAEARAIKEEAEQIRSQAEEQGYNQGYVQGEAQGREEGLKNFETEVTPVLSAFQEMEKLYQDLWSANEPGLVKLAMMIAERTVLHELTTSPETISGAFEAALGHLQEQHQVRFRVNSEDLSYLEQVRGELKDRLKGLVKISLEPDPDLARGDLIMETDSGKMDATVRSRLEAVMSAVNEVFEETYGLDW